MLTDKDKEAIAHIASVSNHQYKYLTTESEADKISDLWMHLMAFHH